ncbi:hypothetical protein [Candidatus Uabimicrobium sp. HlEnr_7]|uniref:hypothetical protein n=1 Tax=Candidatus Uabimicrobium helgolandensis TaxID=3095367 RepID=UPI003557D18D
MKNLIIIFSVVSSVLIGCKAESERAALEAKARKCEKSATKYEAFVNKKEEAEQKNKDDEIKKFDKEVEKAKKQHKKNLSSLRKKLAKIESEIKEFQNEIGGAGFTKESLVDVKTYLLKKIKNALKDVEKIKPYTSSYKSDDMRTIITILKSWKKEIKNLKKMKK